MVQERGDCDTRNCSLFQFFLKKYVVVSSLFHTGKTQNFLSPQFEKEKSVK